MNAYLLNRALGTISPSSFHVAQTSRLVHHLEPAPSIRFSSRKQAQSAESRPEGPGSFDQEDEILAHQAGANVLAIDQYEGRL